MDNPGMPYPVPKSSAIPFGWDSSFAWYFCYNLFSRGVNKMKDVVLFTGCLFFKNLYSKCMHSARLVFDEKMA